MDFYALFRFEDVWQATLDWETYSSSLGPALENRGQFPSELMSIIGMDPPRHVRLRNLVAKGFTPRRIAALEDEIRRIAKRYLDPVSGGSRHFDFQAVLSNKLPMDVISALLGIPEEDRDRYRGYVDRGLERDPDTGLPPREGIEGILRAGCSRPPAPRPPPSCSGTASSTWRAIPERQIYFGHGHHVCIGKSLARLEAKVVLEEIGARFPEYEVDESGLERTYQAHVRGFKVVPITTLGR